MEAIIAYDRNGRVYYDYGNRTNILVDSGEFVSVSGNFIMYRQNGRLYKAEVNSSGYVCRKGLA